MSFGRRILFGGLAAWASRAVNILFGLVLMPVLFRHLSKEELGLWMWMGQSWTALGILDLGFGVVLARQIGFAVAAEATSAQDRRHVAIADLIATGHRVYGALALISFLFSFASGVFYLRTIPLNELNPRDVSCAWGMLCLSQAVSMYASVYVCVVQGLGHVGWDGIFASCTNVVVFLGQLLLLLYGGGLTTLAIATATGALVQRWLLLRFVRFRRPDIVTARGQWRPEVARSMVPTCLRVWLTSLGYLLVANTDQLFIASKEGAAAIPAYRAAFILVINLHLISGVFSGASPIFVSQLWQAGENGKIRSILRRNAQIGLLAMGCGTAAILVLGPNLFEAWLGPGHFVGYPVLMTFLATFLLEHHANVFSTCGRATNDEAYSAWSIAAGILKLSLSFALSPIFGLWGLAFSTLLAQGLTTNWFMVYRSAKRLGLRTIDHVREVLLPCLLVFVLCLFGSKVADTLLQGHHAGLRVPIVAGVAGLILLAALWRIVLNEPQRYELMRGRMLFRAR